MYFLTFSFLPFLGHFRSKPIHFIYTTCSLKLSASYCFFLKNGTLYFSNLSLRFVSQRLLNWNLLFQSLINLVVFDKPIFSIFIATSYLSLFFCWSTKILTLFLITTITYLKKPRFIITPTNSRKTFLTRKKIFPAENENSFFPTFL